jgi:MEMO1 family protein
MTVRVRSLPQGWYPATAGECEAEIRTFLDGFTVPQGKWIGGVAPHAGWYFSGKAAARVIKTLAASGAVDRVVIYGGHLPGRGEPIAYTEDSWETPLGPLPMDAHFTQELVASREAVAAAGSFADNTVEIQLPLVRSLFGETPVIAVHSPASERALRLASAVSGLLTEKGLSAVFIGSADLTHYGPNYGFSPKGKGEAAVRWVKEENDRSLIDKALEMDAKGVLADAEERHNTCSAGPIASVVANASARNVRKGNLLDYYTSYDVMPGSSFVGYAAIVY